MSSSRTQGELFAPPTVLPEGFSYREDYVPAEEEQRLLEHLAGLDIPEARYREWTARRRTLTFGGHYDFSRHQLLPADPIPVFLHPLRKLLADWAGMDDASFTHGNISEYRAGTQLGWHRDAPDYEVVIGASLGSEARMRFRPYPPDTELARATAAIDLQPRSAYIIRDAARWKWQHAISPTKALRYSITFRTLRK
jgi:alkylated DNA repair dioxygenase AlkB